MRSRSGGAGALRPIRGRNQRDSTPTIAQWQGRRTPRWCAYHRIVGASAAGPLRATGEARAGESVALAGDRARIALRRLASVREETARASRMPKALLLRRRG